MKADRTGRRLVEEQLRESEERFRLIVESTIDYAIFMLDPDGRIASWNAGAERIKGYTADDVIGKHFSIFYTPEAIQSGWPSFELQEAVRVGRFEDEGWRVKKDGSRFWANVIITAVHGANGELRGFSKVTRDISERKAHEERIERLTEALRQRVAELDAINRELQQKNTENESFVYSVSHDLRSPLVNLQGFSEELMLTANQLQQLLEQEGVPPAIRDRGIGLITGELDESIGFIRNAVKHLGNIIDGLLRLSRVGRIEYQLQAVDVEGVVQEIVRSMHAQIAASGARVTVHQLPDATGDRSAIGQVFANIIGNALKNLSPSRRGSVEISASGDPPVFAIRDNGVGIAEEYRSKMFRVFQHVHTGATRGEGMGLAIVRRIVERHGGRVWFESQAGKGTTFFFTFGAGVAPGSSPERSE
jgi:PAS domain S-box-containing protein